jgi:peptidyl-prolyl cis-trans isomerase SurA
VTDQLVREAYDRMGQEVNASHILIRVNPDATPQDTLTAYQKVEKIRQQLAAGEDFGKLAREVSEDPSARDNAGKLGYFTAMQMVYPFETVAYKTPVGQVSPPVRTRFGYHLIKVNDKRAAQGEIKVAHLMIRVNANAAKADSLTAKKKIDELYSRLKKGENWDKLVAQFSEDAGSAANGGELPPFGTGRMIPSFEEAAFRLQNAGDLAAPVQTPYGWHIIKLLEKQPLAKFADMEPTLKSKVAKDSRSELNRAAFLKRVRLEDQFVEIPTAKTYAFAKADTALVAGRFKYTAPATPAKANSKAITDNSSLFTIKGKPYTVKDFLTYVQQTQRPRTGAQPAFVMQQIYDQYVDQSLTEFEKNSLDTKYEDYRMLVKEYRDGILLFQLMDEKVWSKAIEDTVGLKKFFADNQAKYQWDQRVQGTVVSAATPTLLARVQRELKTSRFALTKGVAKGAAFRVNTPNINKVGMMALDEVAKRMLQDTLTMVTLTGRVKKGEKASLAKARADSAASYLRKRGGVAARRIKTSSLTAPAESTAQIALTTANPAALETALNEQNPLSIQITQRVFQKGDNKVMDELLAKTPAPGSYDMQKDGRYYTVTIDKMLPAGPKTLAEARGQATSDYQTYLEKEWIAQLRQQYPVKVNEAELNKLVTK